MWWIQHAISTIRNSTISIELQHVSKFIIKFPPTGPLVDETISVVLFVSIHNSIQSLTTPMHNRQKRLPMRLSQIYHLKWHRLSRTSECRSLLCLPPSTSTQSKELIATRPSSFIHRRSSPNARPVWRSTSIYLYICYLPVAHSSG